MEFSLRNLANQRHILGHLLRLLNRKFSGFAKKKTLCSTKMCVNFSVLGLEIRKQKKSDHGCPHLHLKALQWLYPKIAFSNNHVWVIWKACKIDEREKQFSNLSLMIHFVMRLWNVINFGILVGPPNAFLCKACLINGEVAEGSTARYTFLQKMQQKRLSWCGTNSKLFS